MMYDNSTSRSALLLVLFALCLLVCAGVSSGQEPSPPRLSIREARIDANGDFIPDRIGQRITVGGRASSHSGVLHSSRLSVFLQDSANGIELYNIDTGDPIEEGDSVDATGTVEMYEGVTRITRAEYRVIKVDRPMARPLDLTVSEAPDERYEGLLIRVRGAVTRSWNDDYGSFLTLAEQPGDPDTLVVFLSFRHKPGINLSNYSVGDQVAVTGILGQYVRGGRLDGGYEVYPRYPEDIRKEGATAESYLIALLVSAALAVLALIWIVAMRRQVAKRTRELRESEHRFRTLLENVQLASLTIDRETRITFANEYLVELAGWSNEELLAMEIFDLLMPPAGMTRQAFREAVRNGTVPVHFEGELVTRSGEKRLIAWNNTVVHDADGNVEGTASIGEDITERKLVEERLSASLAEKELLVKEVYHRVKNNLQTVSSLLSLQSESIKDPATRELFIENQHRIRSMAMIHERLHRSRTLARIDFREYLQGLATSLFRTYATHGNIALRVDVQDVSLPVDASITCGLIVNELISNSLKHAFPDGRAGEIVITMHGTPAGGYALTFTDNGVGLPEGFDIHGAKTLGMNLIASLTEQLRGELEISTAEGTRYTITVPAA